VYYENYIFIKENLHNYENIEVQHFWRNYGQKHISTKINKNNDVKTTINQNNGNRFS